MVLVHVVDERFSSVFERSQWLVKCNSDEYFLVTSIYFELTISVLLLLLRLSLSYVLGASLMT